MHDQPEERCVGDPGKCSQGQLRANELRQHQVHVTDHALQKFALGFAVDERKRHTAERSRVFQEKRRPEWGSVPEPGFLRGLRKSNPRMLRHFEQIAGVRLQKYFSTDREWFCEAVLDADVLEICPLFTRSTKIGSDSVNFCASWPIRGPIKKKRVPSQSTIKR